MGWRGGSSRSGRGRRRGFRRRRWTGPVGRRDGRLAEVDRHGRRLARLHIEDAELHDRAPLADGLGELVEARERLVAGRDDHVARLDAGLRRGAVGPDLGDAEDDAVAIKGAAFDFIVFGMFGVPDGRASCDADVAIENCGRAGESDWLFGEGLRADQERRGETSAASIDASHESRHP